MKMRRHFLAALILSIALVSCGPDQPMQMNYLYEARNIPLGGTAVCCRRAGTTCLTSHTGFIPLTLRTYIESDSLAAYFLDKDWESEVPEFMSRTDIVDSIIHNNPKALILDNFGLVILKDRNNLSMDSANVHVALRLAPEQDCANFFSQFE